MTPTCEHSACHSFGLQLSKFKWENDEKDIHIHTDIMSCWDGRASNEQACDEQRNILAIAGVDLSQALEGLNLGPRRLVVLFNVAHHLECDRPLGDAVVAVIDVGKRALADECDDLVCGASTNKNEIYGTT
jgi:hypothetical protein